MKNLLIILIVLVISCTSVKADSSPVNLVNEDYVWVYLNVRHGITFTDMYYKYSGTQEVAGKIYHRFVNYKNDEKVYGPDGKLEQSIYDGFEDLVWLAREDNNRLLVIYPSDMESEEYTEYVVNDFNLKTGDLVSDCPYYFEDNWPWDERIMAIGHINIRGSECMVQWCDDIPGEVFIGESLRPIVAGVGNCGAGLHSNLQKENTGMSGIRFSRLLDNEGNVLLDRDTLSSLSPSSDISQVPDIDFSGIEVTDGKVSCHTSDGVEISLALYHPDGRKVSETFGTGHTSLSTSELESGIYVVHATSDGRSTSRKIQVR